VIPKQHPSALEGTGLGKELADRGVNTLVVTGLVTHGCVKATCLDAVRLGYRVILVKDGHSSFHRQAGKLIDEWNEKLSQDAVELVAAGDLDFCSLQNGDTL
jgi:nicotinamidase-related amidase